MQNLCSECTPAVIFCRQKSLQPFCTRSQFTQQYCSICCLCRRRLGVGWLWWQRELWLSEIKGFHGRSIST